MPRQAISVTLDAENLTWLKGRVGAGGGRSVSDLLDQLVTHARTSGRMGPARSVVGTIEIDPDDPLLDRADDPVRQIVERSLGRPMVIRERPAPYGARARARARKRRA